MLSDRFPLQSLRILPRAAWRPYPPIGDRAAWESLPEGVRRAHVEHASSLLERSWPSLPASLYLEFSRTGNRSRFEGPYFERRSMLGSLLLAECMQDRGAFLDRIADGLWLVCEESSWCFPAHVGAQRAGSGLPDTSEPIPDLFAAETAAQLAWAAFLLADRLDRVSPLILPRLRREIASRVIDPFLEREDLSWMGLSAEHGRPNNWNPWINSNVLAAGLLVEDESGRRAAVLSKAIRSLDRFIDPYPRDGGCDEGPAYWGRAGGSLYDCLETLSSVTKGQIDLWSDPLIGEIGRFLARAHIGSDYYVNFADASAVVSPPAGVVYGYGVRIGDPALTALGAALLRRERGVELDGVISPERRLRELFLVRELPRGELREPLDLDTWLRDIQVMLARDEQGSSRGLFVAAKGGHNAESHNHNDVGSFIVYTDGRPLIVDAGVGEYTRATFTPEERYAIWTMQSAYHSLLPTVDGVMQSSGRAYAARDPRYARSDVESSLELDIAGAYPPEAGIRRWHRRVTLRRGVEVEIADRWELEKASREIVLSLLTPCSVTIGGGGELRLGDSPLPGGRRSGTGRLVLEVSGTREPETRLEGIELHDARLGQAWGEGLARICFTLRPSSLSGSLRLTVRSGRA